MTFLFVEHAITPEQLSQGLMGRKTLPKDHGMLFHFPEEGLYSLWSYGCYFPLAVAYLDAEGVITEIYELEAFPEKWQQEGEECTSFFLAHATSPRFVATYALEMEADWFRSHGIKVGDKFQWKENQATFQQASGEL